MNDIIIQAYLDRKLSKKSVDIGNMQENKVTKLIFELDEGITALGGNVYLFVSYDGDTHPYPLKDNSIEIGRELTQRKKTEVNLVVSTSDDPEDILKDVVWISNTLMLFTDKNSINIDSINEQELPPSLKIVYDELFALQSDLQKKLDEDYWRGKDGKDGATFTPTVSDDGILSWTNDKGLQNPKSANIKGPAGKTAYQHAVDGGYKETEEEFRESLVNLMEFEAYKANSILSKSTGEVVTTTDSAKAKPKNIRLCGKTEQDSTEGNQLFDADNMTKKDATVQNGVITITLDSADVYIAGAYSGTDSLFGVAQGNYMVGCSDSNIRITLYYSVNGATASINSASSSNTVSADVSIIGIRVRSIDGTSLLGKSFTIMLNAGNTLKPYEKFTGGEASPNMNYPQPLNSHGDSGSIVGKVLSGNVLKYSYPIGYTETKNGITFTILDDGGINVVGTNTGNEISFNFIKNKDYFLPSGEYTIHTKGITQGQLEIGMWGEDFKKFFSNTSVVFIRDMVYTGTFVEPTSPIASIYVKANATVNTTVYVTLNAGKEALPYEPYTEQPFTVLTPNGLKGIPLGQTIPDAIKNSPIHMAGVYWDNATSQYYIGDTKDYESGEYVQRIWELGIDDFDVSVTGDTGWYNSDQSYSYELKTDGLLDNCYAKDMSTHFTGYGFNEFYNAGVENGCLTGHSYMVVNISKSLGICTTIDEFKQWCIDNDVKFAKILADPITTDLTQEELDQYNALLMNYPNTTVVNDAGAYMEVEYVCDTQKHIEQNYIPKSEHEALKSRVSDIENVIAKL